jgi:hypothetical protein
MRIDYKNLEYLHPMLRAVLQDIEDNLMQEEPTITSQFRIDDPGIHGTMPLRAHDLRCWDTFMGTWVERRVNERWQYDPDRPYLNVCMFHDSGQGKHLHIQVHPNTVKL